MRFVIIILLTVVAMPALAVHPDEVEYWLRRLDESLERRPEYVERKQQRLDNLYHQLENAKSEMERYRACYSLYDEYKAYRSDSATAYARKCMLMANRIGNNDMKNESRIALAFCHISAGLMSEAMQILSTLDSKGMSPKEKADYYDIYSKLWQENASFTTGTPYCEYYRKRSNAYMDSLLHLMPRNTSDYYMRLITHSMRTGNNEKSIEAFRQFQKLGDVGEHDKAMTYAVAAWAFTALGQPDSAKVCFARSAIYDNESSTREITALYLLAERIYKDDYERASRYIHIALSDITFYDSRQRKIDLGAILPLIEQDRYEAIRSQRNYFLLAAVLVVVLLVVSLLSAWFVRRKNAKIVQAQKTISENMAQLREVNRQLTEAQKIKDEYIGMSFCANSEILARLQRFVTVIDNKIAARQYSEIRAMLDRQTFDNERMTMYASFDEAFLKLFPDFIEKYNNLFEEQYRVEPRKNTLTSEMRIFALIRLGVTDSERIAKFLNYSVHTVNTYKTRVKNRSLLDNSKFEPTIMEI